MRLFRTLSLGLVFSAVLLTGCQSLQPYTQPLEKPTVEAKNQFNLQGKIGVKTPEQSGSAFFTWVQEQENFDLELTGILGVGKTQITGRPGEVTLNSAKTGLIQADTPEDLLLQATGWQAPITHLVQWVQARPATINSSIKTDDQQRPIQIIEDHWLVTLSYNDDAKLPNKLILKQALESGAENRITMVIQNR